MPMYDKISHFLGILTCIAVIIVSVIAIPHDNSMYFTLDLTVLALVAYYVKELITNWGNADYGNCDSIQAKRTDNPIFGE